MAKTISDYIINRKSGIKVCKICQAVIENEEEHMRLRHPKYLKYLSDREKKEDRFMCCYCGLWVKNWKEHMQKSHPDIIKNVSRRVKPKKEKEELEFQF
ncbi:hypothetical protein EU523_01710 [Candidatus Heimdallarchaeota archaeon]|nr:MAG: hypothetical protein EU523_01710 [Candidatus Heimdallarchaeota archaeon]